MGKTQRGTYHLPPPSQCASVPDTLPDHVRAEDIVVDGEGGAQLCPLLPPPTAHIPTNA